MSQELVQSLSKFTGCWMDEQHWMAEFTGSFDLWGLRTKRAPRVSHFPLALFRESETVGELSHWMGAT